MAGLRAHARRVVGTLFAVVFGVAFVSGTFIFTDTAKAGFKSTPQLARYPGRGGAAIKVPHRDGLANQRVRFVGQEVALVVANSAAAAQDASEKIEIEYRDFVGDDGGNGHDHLHSRPASGRPLATRGRTEAG